ncbi:MAG: hypothetical protein QXE01_02520 [Sulfolobales archaeon]
MDLKSLIDRVAGKSLAHAIGIYIYYKSDPDEASSNVMATLSEGFDRNVAENVLNDILMSFKGFSHYNKVVVEGNEISLYQFVPSYVYKTHIAPHIEREARNRLANANERDLKMLTAASAIISAMVKKKRIGLALSVDRGNEGEVRISSRNVDNLSAAVSIILRSSVDDVRKLFYKYLLGAQLDWGFARHDYYVLEIYSDTLKLVEFLALRISNYIKIPNRPEIESILATLYEEKDILKLSILYNSIRISTYKDWEFLSAFFGLPKEHLCKESSIENIFYNCAVNPLIYEDVRDIIEYLYNKYVNELSSRIIRIFEYMGYSKSSCVGNKCVLTKTGRRPVFIYIEPIVKYPYIFSSDISIDSYKIIFIEGIPSESILKYIASDAILRDFLWIFISNDTAYIASTTYKHIEHSEIVNAVSQWYKVRFLGAVPAGATQMIQQAEVKREIQSVTTQLISISREISLKYRGKDILEDVVASVLEDLGFSVRVDYRVRSRAGTDVEIDVWGEKGVGGSHFYVYASCKNLDRPVEVSTIREEFGRIMQMPVIPHVRLMVASKLTDSARREAIADGFIVIEVGKKTTEENVEEVYKMIYSKLNEIFVNIAPTWLQELANKILKIAEELKKISEELSKIPPTK